MDQWVLLCPPGPGHPDGLLVGTWVDHPYPWVAHLSPMSESQNTLAVLLHWRNCSRKTVFVTAFLCWELVSFLIPQTCSCHFMVIFDVILKGLKHISIDIISIFPQHFSQACQVHQICAHRHSLPPLSQSHFFISFEGVPFLLFLLLTILCYLRDAEPKMQTSIHNTPMIHCFEQSQPKRQA